MLALAAAQAGAEPLEGAVRLPGPSNSTVAVCVTLRGGSRLSGSPGETDLAYATSFGQIAVPWSSVLELSHVARSTDWILKTDRRAILHGEPCGQALSISNVFGSRRFPFDGVATIRQTPAPQIPAGGDAARGVPCRRAILMLDDGTRLLGEHDAGEMRFSIAELGVVTALCSAVVGITNGPPPGEALIRLHSGDDLIGNPVDPHIVFNSTVGPLRIPWDRVRRLVYSGTDRPLPPPPSPPNFVPPMSAGDHP